MPVDASADDVRHRLESDCYFLKQKISVSKITDNMANDQMGVEFEIHFHGMSGTLENYEMIPSVDDPIVGATLVYTSETTRPFGESIIFPVVPPEFFFTNEEIPQVIIQVDEYPVLCGKLNCGFEYVDQTSRITGFTVSGLDVTISGTDLPLEVTSVLIAQIVCTIDSENVPSTATQTKCTLAEPLPAGSWLPKMKDEFGLIIVDESVAALEIAMVISDISP